MIIRHILSEKTLYDYKLACPDTHTYMFYNVLGQLAQKCTCVDGTSMLEAAAMVRAAIDWGKTPIALPAIVWLAICHHDEDIIKEWGYQWYKEVFLYHYPLSKEEERGWAAITAVRDAGGIKMTAKEEAAYLADIGHGDGRLRPLGEAYLSCSWDGNGGGRRLVTFIASCGWQMCDIAAGMLESMFDSTPCRRTVFS